MMFWLATVLTFVNCLLLWASARAWREAARKLHEAGDQYELASQYLDAAKRQDHDKLRRLMSGKDLN